MNQQPSFEDHVSLKIHHQQPPWSKIEMSKEPETHKLNKEFREKYLSSCFDEVYNLTPNEIREWWELRIDLYFLYDSQVENHVKRLTSVWFLLTDTECESLKHDKWIQFGFQQADPTSDLRGGGVQALDDMINFIAQYRDYVLKEMCSPTNDFYFAASSINVTFFMKKYFHFHEKLDIRQKNVLNIHKIGNSKQSCIQKFLSIISQRRQFLVKTSQNASYGFVLDLDPIEGVETRYYNSRFWISTREDEMQGQRNIFSLNLYKLRLIELILQIIKMSIRYCTKKDHQNQPITFVNFSDQAQDQRFACGLCYFYAQEKNKDNFTPISTLNTLVADFVKSYNMSQFETETKNLQKQYKQLVTQSLNLSQRIQDQFNKEIMEIEIPKKQINLKIQSLSQKAIEYIDQDDINMYIQLKNEQEQQNQCKSINYYNLEQTQQIKQITNKIEKMQIQIDNLLNDLILQSSDIIYMKQQQLPSYLQNEIQNLLQQTFKDTQLLQEQQKDQNIIKINDQIYYSNSHNSSQIISDGFGKLFNQKEDVLYIGNWKDQKFNEGIKIYLSTNQLFFGKFQQVKENTFSLFGKGYWTNEQEIKYEGHFIQDKFEGSGKKTDIKNDITIEGQWKNGQLCNGVKETKEYIYVGGLTIDDKFQGQGTYTDKLNNVEKQGNFINNLLEGKGTESQLVFNKAEDTQNQQFDLTQSIFQSFKKPNQQKKVKTISRIEEGLYSQGKKIQDHLLYEIDEYENKILIKITYYDDQGNYIFEEKQN